MSRVNVKRVVGDAVAVMTFPMNGDEGGVFARLMVEDKKSRTQILELELTKDQFAMFAAGGRFCDAKFTLTAAAAGLTREHKSVKVDVTSLLDQRLPGKSDRDRNRDVTMAWASARGHFDDGWRAHWDSFHNGNRFSRDGNGNTWALVDFERWVDDEGKPVIFDRK